MNRHHCQLEIKQFFWRCIQTSLLHVFRQVFHSIFVHSICAHNTCSQGKRPASADIVRWSQNLTAPLWIYTAAVHFQILPNTKQFTFFNDSLQHHSSFIPKCWISPAADNYLEPQTLKTLQADLFRRKLLETTFMLSVLFCHFNAKSLMHVPLH